MVKIVESGKWLVRQCEQCPTVTDSRSAWLIHRKEHIASSRVDRSTTLKGIENVSEEKSCDICNKVFATVTELTAHVRVHSKNAVQRPAARPVIGIFQCSTCRKSFSTRNEKLRHQKNHCPGFLEHFLCEVCNEKFETKETYLRHVKTHSPLSCDMCCRMFDDEQALKVHSCNSGTSDGKDGGLLVVKCPLCPMLFPSQNSCNSHRKAHKASSNTSDPHPTQVTVGPILQQSDVNPSCKKPILLKTKNGFKCNICGKYTITLNGGRKHMKSHLTISKQKLERNFKCPFCSRGFVSLNATYGHIAVNHPEMNVN